MEADGPHHALAVFVNPPGRFGVDLEDPSVVYYGPGVHHAGQIVLKVSKRYIWRPVLLCMAA